jgi:hypothetical protein
MGGFQSFLERIANGWSHQKRSFQHLIDNRSLIALLIFSDGKGASQLKCLRRGNFTQNFSSVAAFNKRFATSVSDDFGTHQLRVIGLGFGGSRE